MFIETVTPNAPALLQVLRCYICTVIIISRHMVFLFGTVRLQAVLDRHYPAWLSRFHGYLVIPEQNPVDTMCYAHTARYANALLFG